MRTYSLWVVAIVFSIAANQALAHSYGPSPGVTGAPGDSARACTQCHAGTLNSGAGSVQILLQSGPVYIPGVKQRITVKVSDPDQQRWGFEMTARLNSDLQNAQAGDFTVIDNFTQVICQDTGPKPCLSGPSFIEHTSAGTRNGTKGGAAFQFDWTPPATNLGPITFYVAGNAANGNGSSAGDLIYTSSVQLDPAVPLPPSIAPGSILNNATSAAGPAAPNTWVSVYGSNLGVTTRSWNDADIINGAFPFSLDGVSVVLTGAPRLAYVGFVSPTLVNFLLPSDLSPGTVQVQIRNTAGISKQVPITVQASAPQVLLLDGKYVSAIHSNSSVIAKSGLLSSTGIATTPAAPGETITLYGTGLGPTNPALIPGQMPTQAANLVTLPQVTIGDKPATVTSAATLPNAPGVYQIKVQIAADVANGDQPVVVQAGGVNSSSALITILK